LILGNILGSNQVKSEVEKISTEITKALDNSSVKSAIQNMTLQMPEGQFDATKIANYVDSLDHLDEKQKESIISTSALSSKQKEQVQAVRAVKTATEANATATNMDATSKNTNTVATKAMTVAQNGLNAALSIGKALLKSFLITAAFMAVEKAISWLSEKIDDAIETQEEYLEKQREIIDKSDEIISATESEINALEGLQKKIKATNGVQSEMLKLADEVSSVFGKGSENILTQANAYEVLNARIKANLAMQEEEQKRAKKDKQEALLKESRGQSLPKVIHDLNEIDNAEYVTGIPTIDEYREALNAFWQGKGKPGSHLESVKDYEAIGKLIDDTLNLEDTGEYLENEAARAKEYFDDYISSSIDSALIEGIIDSLVVSGYTIGYDLDVFEEAFKKLEDNSKEIESLWGEYNTVLKENGDTFEVKTQLDKIFTEIVSDGENINYAMGSVFKDYFTQTAIAFAEQVQEEQNKQYVSFEEVWNNNLTKDTQEELLDLAKSGELTSETLKTTEEYADLLNKTGLEAKDAKGHILDLLDSTEKLAMASSGTESLFGAYEEYLSKGFVTASTLEGLPELFKELEGFDAFEAIVGNPQSDVTAIQQAFDNILTEWYKSNEVIKGITEENKETYIANMKDMNIGNAEEVAKSYLDMNKLLIEAEKEYSEYLGDDPELLEERSKNYIDYINSKGALDQAYFDELGSSNGQLFKLLGQAYSDDFANFSKLIAEKIKAQAKFDAIFKKGYDANKSMVENLQNNGSNMSASSIADAYTAQAEMNRAEQSWKDYIDELNAELALVQTNFKIDFDGIGEGSSTVEDFNWIETLISRIERNITNLGKTISATYKTWSERNSAIKSEYTELNKELQAQINAQKYYENKAAQVSLSESYKKKVRNGEISIESISNENLKEAIQKYQELWEAALEAKDAQEDIRASMVENFQTAFDLIQSEYDLKISEIEGRGSILDALIGQQEAKGHIVSKNYYEDLAKLANNEIALLTEEYNRLNNALNSSDIKEGTEMWYELKGEIYGIQEALIGARTELIEYYNKMHELDWSVFDKQREAIERVAEEAEFLIDLMSNEELFDSDTGSMTEYGTATMGLRVANYNTYMKEAQDAAEELAKVEKQIANNQLDGTSEQVIERKNELLELQRESILAAQGEMQAIKDLKNEYYDNLLDVLQKLIDKKKEALNAEKDLYSYQKNIAEKSQNINSLKKQLMAYEGDNTEETQAKVQKLQLELKNAESDLEETQYEKWLDDQNQMLDNLLADAQSWIEAALKNLETVITDAIGITNEHSGEIRKTLYQIASEYGYDMTDEMKAIWDSDGDIASIFEKGEFVSTEAKILTTLEGIADNIVKMVEKSDKEAVSNGSKGNNTTTSYTPPASTPATTPSTPAKSTSSSNNTSSNSNKKWGSWFVSKKDNTPDSRLNINTSIVD
jgi:DNA repair exonuclease SbcCD ATPase subunit